MADPDLGTKQICPNCEAKFYDLNKRPAVCPKCKTEFDPEDDEVRTTSAKLKAKRAKSAVPADEEEDDLEEET